MAPAVLYLSASQFGNPKTQGGEGIARSWLIGIPRTAIVRTLVVGGAPYRLTRYERDPETQALTAFRYEPAGSQPTAPFRSLRVLP